MERHPRFPNFWAAVLILLAAFALQLTAGVLLVSLRRGAEGWDPMMGIIAAMISFGALISWLTNYKGLSYRRLFHDTASSVKAVVAVLGPPVLLFVSGATILLIDLDSLILRWAPPSEEQLAWFRRVMSGGMGTLIALGLAAPVLEETLFRGIFLRSFLQQYPPERAIFLSSLLFALAHLNLYQAVAAFMLGLFLAWLYLRTASLWPCILAHAVYNLNALAWTWLTTDANNFPNNTAIIEFPPFGFQVIGVGLTALGGWILARVLRPARS